MDENSKLGGDGGAQKFVAENDVLGNPNCGTNSGDVEGPGDVSVGASESNAMPASRQPSSRTPFTNLSQVEADLALARTLQEQERAYMMLRMNGTGGNYGSWEDENYYHDDDDDYVDPDGHQYNEVDDDEDEDDFEDDENNEGNDLDGGGDGDGEDDAFDVHAHAESGDAPPVEVDPAAFPDDEAFARALQGAEEREMAAGLLAMAGIAEREVEDLDDHGRNSQDAWEEADLDELSYEELLALGEVVGTESRGLSADTIASLPSINYNSANIQDGECGTCVICRLEYEDGDTLTLLTCKHSYHSECINNWLKINKVCPVCSTEVSTSGMS